MINARNECLVNFSTNFNFSSPTKKTYGFECVEWCGFCTQVNVKLELNIICNVHALNGSKMLLCFLWFMCLCVVHLTTTHNNFSIEQRDFEVHTHTHSPMPPRMCVCVYGCIKSYHTALTYIHADRIIIIANRRILCVVLRMGQQRYQHQH